MSHYRERYDRWREEMAGFDEMSSTAATVSVFGASYAVLAIFLYLIL